MRRLWVGLVVVCLLFMVACDNPFDIDGEPILNDGEKVETMQKSSVASENEAEQAPKEQAIDIAPAQEKQQVETQQSEAEVADTQERSDVAAQEVITVEKSEVDESVLENFNRFIEAVGYDENGEIVVRYAAGIAYSNLDDADFNNDTMKVTIEAFDEKDNLLWKDTNEFEEYVCTELGDFAILLVDRAGNLLVENLNFNESSTLRCLSKKDGSVVWADDVFCVDIFQDENYNYYYTQYYGADLVSLNAKGHEQWRVDFSDGDKNFWPTMEYKNGDIVITSMRYFEGKESKIMQIYDLNGVKTTQKEVEIY
jgi:hypothetical protein